MLKDTQNPSSYLTQYANPEKATLTRNEQADLQPTLKKGGRGASPTIFLISKKLKKAF